MKELSTYITEKLDINKVALNDINFPIDSSIEDICEYLKSQGFIEIPDTGIKSELYSVMNKKKGKVFVKVKDWFIRFADTSNHDIDKNHPVYAIFYDKRYYIEWINSINKDDFSLVPKEEFLKLLNDKFRWR